MYGEALLVAVIGEIEKNTESPSSRRAFNIKNVAKRILKYENYLQRHLQHCCGACT